MASWLPLIITILVMPALAWATTQFVLLPKLKSAVSGKAEPEAAHGKAAEAPSAHGAAPAEPAAASGGHGAPAAGGHGAAAQKGKEGGKKLRQTFPMSKMIVNVAGTLGTRYLMTSMTLAGDSPDFVTAIEENRAKLLDLAQTALSSKTINDLERPGARNQIRAELIAILNNAIGTPIVQEIFFTEFAIQ
jgi:flagellar FliL protein